MSKQINKFAMLRHPDQPKIRVGFAMIDQGDDGWLYVRAMADGDKIELFKQSIDTNTLTATKKAYENDVQKWLAKGYTLVLNDSKLSNALLAQLKLDQDPYLAPDPNCGYCALRVNPAFFGSAPVPNCSICARPPSSHKWDHPHAPSKPSGTGCNQFSLMPQQWAALGFSAWNTVQQASVAITSASSLMLTDQNKIEFKPAVQLAAPQPNAIAGTVDDCEFCDRKQRPGFPEWYKSHKCANCGLTAGLHVPWHPHGTGSANPGWCDGFVLESKRAEPEPSPPLELQDLPCNCGERHYLSVHGKRNGPTGGWFYACLVMDCGCEQYRRTCRECGEQTRLAWRHMPWCLTGAREKPDYEPEPVPVDALDIETRIRDEF